ncbi:cytochrome c oxidase subunit II [Halovivax sp.]|uniref:cytochrome c oxidase subunit II n=1 Tax=Halovivax sp. TaxID=1935978 RepID=UPI0025C20BEB|nr:cytochrome c oxidase subunit II [Halovivax sp.]
MNTIYAELLTPLQQTRVDVFEEIFLVFLGLGTLVGIVVVAYTMYNAYKYRDVEEQAAEDVDRPTVGELPVGGEGGKKLFLSFGLSAIIVVSLIIWTYGMLLYVEDGPDELENGDNVEIDVTASAFAFSYDYQYQDDEYSVTNELIVPQGEPVEVDVTSSDVWHTFGISQERVKADAIPGESDETWFVAEETGQFENAVECFELCGNGHSSMQHDMMVVDADLFDAAFEAGAVGELWDAIEAGELSVDSSPEELDQHLEDLEAEEEADDEDDDEAENDNDDDGDGDDEDEADEDDDEGGED